MSTAESYPVSSYARLLRPSALRELHAAGELPRLSLAGGLPPAEAFPFERVAEIAAELFGGRDLASMQYTSAEGDLRLRRAIAERLGGDWHRPVEASDVVVLSGSQQGIDLVARVLLDPGDVAVVESPTYVGALRAIVPTGAEVVEIGVDDRGLLVDQLAEQCAVGLRPKLVSLVVNFSNPSGRTLAEERRRQLVELADRYGFVIVEDDQYGRLRFAGDRCTPLAALGERVIHLGGFSKIVAPGLRLGYLVAPPELRRPLILAKQAADLAPPSFAQRLVTRLLDDPVWLDAHVDTLRGIYARRAGVLLGRLEAVSGLLDVVVPEGGMFTWATLTDPEADAGELVDEARRRGLIVVAGNDFSIRGAFPRSIRLSYSTLPDAELAEAGTLLAEVVEQLSRTSR